MNKQIGLHLSDMFNKDCLISVHKNPLLSLIDKPQFDTATTQRLRQPETNIRGNFGRKRYYIVLNCSFSVSRLPCLLNRHFKSNFPRGCVASSNGISIIVIGFIYLFTLDPSSSRHKIVLSSIIMNILSAFRKALLLDPQAHKM